MSKNEMITKIEALREWEALMEEAKAEAEAIRDELKQTMLAADVEEMEAGAYILRYTAVLSQRFDTTSMLFQKRKLIEYSCSPKSAPQYRNRSFVTRKLLFL